MNNVPKHIEEFVREYNKYTNKAMANPNGKDIIEAIKYCDIYIKSNWTTCGEVFKKENIIDAHFSYPLLLFHYKENADRTCALSLNMLDSNTVFLWTIEPKKKITLKQLIGEGD